MACPENRHLSLACVQAVLQLAFWGMRALTTRLFAIMGIRFLCACAALLGMSMAPQAQPQPRDAEVRCLGHEAARQAPLHFPRLQLSRQGGREGQGEHFISCAASRGPGASRSPRGPRVTWGRAAAQAPANAAAQPSSRNMLDTRDFFAEAVHAEANRYTIREVIGKGRYGC